MNLDAIRDGLNEAWTSVAAFTPKLAAAVIILFAGWLAARIVRTIAGRVLDLLRFDDVVERAGVHAAAERTGYDPKGIVTGVVYWIVLFVTFQLAAETLGADQLSQLLAALVGFLPNVLVAVALILVAMAFASFVAGAIRANVTNGDTGARIAYWAITVFGAVAALNQVELAESTVNTLFIAAVGTVAASMVVAFGVGSIPVARDLVSTWTNRSEVEPVKRAA